jgi:polyferredoxin
VRIVTARRISQTFFLALFLWFCLAATLGDKWWQLRGWPINWLLELDPLLALGTVLTTGVLYAGLLWAVVTVVLTLVLGRVWCGWICPLGTLNHFIGWLGRRKQKTPERQAVNRYRRASVIKYYILVGLLTAAAGGLIGRVLSAPTRGLLLTALIGAALATVVAGLALVRSGHRPWRAGLATVILVGAWLAAAFWLPLDRAVASSLQSGLLDPLPLVYRSVNLVVAPLVDSGVHVLSVKARIYEGAWLIGGLFGTILLLNLVIPRFYCRYVCPLGALLGVLGRFALWRIGKERAECRDCGLCDLNCEGACQPAGELRQAECLVCFNCRETCPDDEVVFSPRKSAAGEIASPDLSRRGFTLSVASGLAAVPLLRLTGGLGPGRNPGVVRPPGALAESRFLDRCTKCGQCLRVCPTNVIQPAGLQAGLEGLWTPILDFRVGTSGCQLNCIACGQLCPTGAIRPLTLDQKNGRGRFAKQGPIRIGLAFVDRNRCLPWALDRPCIVCQENCPFSPKAIFTQTVYQTVRGGIRPVVAARPDQVTLGGGPLPPDRLGSGDYFVQIGADPRTRRRIKSVSGQTVILDGNRPGGWPLPKGARVRIVVRLQRPLIDPRRCTGCGICEHECPVTGRRAIRVTAENESRRRDRTFL